MYLREWRGIWNFCFFVYLLVPSMEENEMLIWYSWHVEYDVVDLFYEMTIWTCVFVCFSLYKVWHAIIYGRTWNKATLRTLLAEKAWKEEASRTAKREIHIKRVSKEEGTIMQLRPRGICNNSKLTHTPDTESKLFHVAQKCYQSNPSYHQHQISSPNWSTDLEIDYTKEQIGRRKWTHC